MSYTQAVYAADAGATWPLSDWVADVDTLHDEVATPSRSTTTTTTTSDGTCASPPPTHTDERVQYALNLLAGAVGLWVLSGYVCPPLPHEGGGGGGGGGLSRRRRADTYADTLVLEFGTV